MKFLLTIIQGIPVDCLTNFKKLKKKFLKKFFLELAKKDFSNEGAI